MEENKTMPAAKRGRRLALAIVAGAAAVILLAYLGLCIYAGASDRVLPGVAAGQVDLGGMSREEAATAVDRWQEQAYANTEYRLEGASSGVSIAGSLTRVDGEQVARAALDVGRSEPFLKRGAVILAQYLGGRTQVPCPVELSGEGEAQLDRALDELARTENEPLVETVWSVQGDKLVIVKGVTGKTLDRELARTVLLDAMQQPGGGGAVAPMTLAVPRVLDLQQVHSEIYAQVADAYIVQDEQGACQVVPHVVGVDFFVDQAVRQLAAAGEGETLHVKLVVTQPEVTGPELQGKLFAHVLAECTTSISGTENRLNNVIVATRAIDGVVLMPGEVFSYNDTLGPRNTANGYLPAPAYIGGKTVDDVGGGICQDSSTLYYATLKANLEIVERTNHMYVVGYVPDGLDATVVYNAIDFKFRNDTPYPIRISAQVNKRKLTVKLEGTRTTDNTVKMVTETLSTTPYEVLYKPDSTVAVGQTVVDTTAYTGRKIRVYRCVYDGSGELISKTLESTNNYRHRDKVILYNPADAAALGLVDSEGKVHETVQPILPEPEPAPAPAPAPTPESTPAPTPEQQPAPEVQTGGQTGEGEAAVTEPVDQQSQPDQTADPAPGAQEAVG